MVRMIVFSVIAFGVAYLLYVFPVLALLSLFNGSEIVSLWSILPTALVFLLIRLYLATSITNRALRAFVFYGMGVGFLSALILSVLLLFRWLGVSDGQVLGAIAVFFDRRRHGAFGLQREQPCREGSGIRLGQDREAAQVRLHQRRSYRVQSAKPSQDDLQSAAVMRIRRAVHWRGPLRQQRFQAGAHPCPWRSWCRYLFRDRQS